MNVTGIHFTRFRDTAPELYAQFKGLLKEGYQPVLSRNAAGLPEKRDPGTI